MLGALTIALGATPASPEVAPSCPAQPVSGEVVRVGPFRGMLARQYDVVDGRFRLHVGSYRDKAIGLSQKIPWFVSTRAGTSPHLLVTGKRLSPGLRTFRQSFGRAGYPGQEAERRYVYPSTLSPPAAGCWHLRFRSGKVDARVTVLVRNG